MAGLALRFNTAFLAIATTYSTSGSASRKASNSGCAKPPSRRTRMRTPGKKVADQLHQPTQNPHRTGRRRHVAGTQHGGAQILFGFVIEADETHHRQVAPGVVVAVEERQLLRAVGGIVGRIQIDGDAADATAQPLGMALDHAGGQRLAQTIEFLALRWRSQNATASAAKPDRGPRPDRGRAASCESDRRPGGPHRWRPDSRRRSRTRAAPEAPARNDRPCPLAAGLAGSQPGRRSIRSAGRQPSAAGLRHRNCPAADRTAARQAWEKSRGTTNTVSCYCRTREGLSCCFKHCLSNMFVSCS